MTLIQDGCGLPITETGLLLRAGGQDFPQLLGMWLQLISFANRRKIEPEETPSCLIPHLLVIFTQQLKILVTTLTKCSISTILPNNRGPWTVYRKKVIIIYIYFFLLHLSQRGKACWENCKTLLLKIGKRTMTLTGSHSGLDLHRPTVCTKGQQKLSQDHKELKHMQLNQKSTDPIFIVKLHTTRSIILIYFPLDKMMNIKEICCTCKKCVLCRQLI